MGSCISCKTRHRRFAQSGQPIRRINVRKRDEFTRTVELYKLEFVELCLIISESPKPPEVINLFNDLKFKLTSINECSPDDFCSRKDKIKKKCLICWKKMCNCSNCSSRCSVISTCCNQTYHYKCFNKWMKIKSICPICKRLMFLIKEKRQDKETKKLSLSKYITCTYKLCNGRDEEVNISNAFQINEEYEDPALFDDLPPEDIVNNVPENSVSESRESEYNDNIEDIDNDYFDNSEEDLDTTVDEIDDVEYSVQSDPLGYFSHQNSIRNYSNTDVSVYSS